MKIVPVLDLQAGNIVRAVAGQREAYRPIESRLHEGCEPTVVARALVDKFGFGQAYLADLDAIAGAEPAWETYTGLIDCGLRLWIDAGLSDQGRIARMAAFADRHPEIVGIVFGLESVPDLEAVTTGLVLAGPQRFIFSLDIKNGRPLARWEGWQGKVAADIAGAVIQAGVQQILMIDLATVGMHGGCGTQRLCHILHRKYPQVKFYAGGGVRGPADLEALQQRGCAAALVSSALHDGWLQPADLEPYEGEE